MTYVITQPCIDVKDKSCVDVCPVSCIYFESDGLERKLQNASSFKDTAHVLRMTRAGVAWEAVGCGMGALRACARLRQTAAAVRTSDRPIPTGPGSAGPDARQYHRFTVPGLAPLADAGRRHDAGGARVSGEGLLRSPTRTTRRRRISCSWSPKPWTRRGTMACPCTPARSATGASWLTRSAGHQGHRQAPRMRPSIDGD